MSYDFMRRLCPDSQAGKTEELQATTSKEAMDEMKNRYIYSYERTQGMSFEDYAKSQAPKHPYDGINGDGEREFGVEKERELAEAGDTYGTPVQEGHEAYMVRRMREEDAIAEAKRKAAKPLKQEEIDAFENEFRMSTFGPLDPEAEQAEDQVEMAVNPKHYKDVVPGMQYVEMMTHMLKDPESHLMGQIYKYLMRNGKKDDEIQELKKVHWYLTGLLNWKIYGKVIINDNKTVGEPPKPCVCPPVKGIVK